MMKPLLTGILLLSLATPAAAAEKLNMYQHGRAAYSDHWDNKRAQYESEAQSYVDAQYLYGGERDGDASGASDAEAQLTDAEIDAFIDSTVDLDADAKAPNAPTEAPPLPSSAQ